MKHFNHFRRVAGFTPLVEDGLAPKAFPQKTPFSIFNMFISKLSLTNTGRKNARPSFTTGFTLVELLVVLAIITVLLAVFIFRYKDYTQMVIVNRLANEVALTLREAQFYATGVKEFEPGSDNFSGWYDVNFYSEGYLFRALEEADFSSNRVTLGAYLIANPVDLLFYESVDDTVPEDVDDVTVIFRKANLSSVIRKTAGPVDGYRLEVAIHSPDMSVTRRVCVEQTGRIFISKASSCISP
ncbi:MAG: type II secretion system protein [Candidatus Pacebacteria bacterium]|nr:type II secretion system protein [Candidatus Paceibacterota bacterium]